MTRFLLLSALLAGLSQPAKACAIALALAVDVSGSVDPADYRIQMGGLAEALRDPVVAEALVRSEAAVSLVQWTGQSRQNQSVGWRRIEAFEDVDALADEIADMPRHWYIFSTAIGEALEFTRLSFDEVADCKERVIDVSGDGSSNEGVTPDLVHPGLNRDGITVNALVIEGHEEDLTTYFRENVITGPGAFAIRANSFRDYPKRIREKLIRELSLALSRGPDGCAGLAICDHTFTSRDHSVHIFAQLRQNTTPGGGAPP